MLAIEFHGRERIELVERPTPRPGAGHLLVAPVAVGVCGTDVEIYEGSMAYYRAGVARYPVVPGHEWVAQVIEVGTGVDGFVPGDWVVGECSIGCGRCDRCRAGQYHVCRDRTETGVLNRDGGMATELVFPARSAFPVPVGLRSAEAALVEPTAVALNGVRRGAVAGRNVLVLGAGPIGLLAAQCARAEGAAAVLVSDPVSERRTLAAELGADATLSPGGSHPDDLAAVRDYVGADDLDVVLVCTGAPAALAVAGEVVRPGGDIVVLGLFGRPDVSVDIDRLVVRDVTVHGVLGSPNLWSDAIALLADGRVQATPLVAELLPLTRVAEALHHVRAGSGRAVKFLIAPNDKDTW